MKHVSCSDQSRRSWLAIVGGWAFPLCLTLCLLVGAIPTFGYWLPWAKEQDKITRRLNEIWAALIDNDRHSLRGYLTGNAVEPFIDQERAYVESFKIKQYGCKVEKIDIDKVRGEFAWVELVRNATQEGGSQITDRFLKVMKKVGNDWKLLTNTDDVKKKTEKVNAVDDQKDFYDLVRQKLPGKTSR